MNRAIESTLAPGALMLAVSLCAAQAPPQTPRAPRLEFSDATQSAGIDFVNVCGAPPEAKGWLTESLGAGAAWLDYDGDGHLDLYLVNGSSHERKPGAGEPNRLFRNNGRGSFSDATARAKVADRGWGYGVAVGDYDNDGDPDIYVTNHGPNVLYRNNGDGTFVDATAEAGAADARWGASAAFFDVEGDGDLDLYVANYMVGDPKKVPRKGSEAAESFSCMYKNIKVFCGPLGQTPVQDVLYLNDGSGKFSDATRKAGMWLDKPRYSLGVVSGDYDNDGDADLYVANDSVRNSLWRNDGDGTFTDVGVASLSALNADGRVQAGMGVGFGDYDADGWLDIIVTNFAHDLNTLYRNVEGKLFLDESSLAGLGITNLFLSWGTGFYDLDHDADLDLFIANGHIYPEVDAYDLGTRYRQRNHLFLNRGSGRFVESSATMGPGLAVERSFRATAFADYDNDGDVDALVTAMDAPPLLLRNDLSDGGHYLTLQLIGVDSNRDGVGARVTLSAGGRTQMRERTGGGSYLSASDPRVHFGLGSAKRVDRLQVRWPSGTTDVLLDVAADRVLTLREGSSRPASAPR